MRYGLYPGEPGRSRVERTYTRAARGGTPREEGVELAVEDLPPLDGGNAGVADGAHGVPSL